MKISVLLQRYQHIQDYAEIISWEPQFARMRDSSLGERILAIPFFANRAYAAKEDCLGIESIMKMFEANLATVPPQMLETWLEILTERDLPIPDVKSALARRIPWDQNFAFRYLTEAPLNIFLRWAVELQDDVSCRPKEKFNFPQGIIRGVKRDEESLEGFWYHSWLLRPNRARIRLLYAQEPIAYEHLQSEIENMISLWIELLKGNIRDIPDFQKF